MNNSLFYTVHSKFSKRILTNLIFFKILYSANDLKDRVVIEIDDDGIGINPDAAMRKIFDRSLIPTNATGYQAINYLVSAAQNSGLSRARDTAISYNGRAFIKGTTYLDGSRLITAGSHGGKKHAGTVVRLEFPTKR